MIRFPKVYESVFLIAPSAYGGGIGDDGFRKQVSQELRRPPFQSSITSEDQVCGQLLHSRSDIFLSSSCLFSYNYTHTHTLINIRTHTHIYIHTYAHTFTYIHMHPHSHRETYTYTHSYTPKCTHTHPHITSHIYLTYS